MNGIFEHIELIQRIDQLIRLEATGTPALLADRLGMSKSKLYRLINTMKSLGAPIEYDMFLQSYVYSEAVGFRFGFYHKHEILDQPCTSIH